MASFTWPPQGTGGGGGGVTSLNTLTGAVVLAAGTNITLTPSGNTITISSSGSGSGTVTSVSVVTANGLSGTVATATTTPAITLAPTFTGIAFSNGSAFAAAIASNFPTLNQNTTGSAASLSSPLPLSGLATQASDTIVGNNTGGSASPTALTVAQVNAILPVFTSSLNGLAPLSGGGTTNYLRADGTWAAPPGATSGTVTTVSVASANGFAGTVANPTTTPAITISTTITGILKGNGTAISAATAGTDYVIPSGNITGTAGNITATSNSTLTTLSSLSLPVGQLTGTLPVANGGTGDSSLTAYAVLAGGTTTTAPIQQVSGVGTSGQVLTSNGASALPTWQTLASTSAVYYDGFQGTGGAIWSSTSTSYADPALASGSAALTANVSSGITATAAAGSLAGITFTPSSSSNVYLVTAVFSILNGSTSDETAVQLTDGTNIIGSTNGQQSATNTTSYFPASISGIYAPGTSSAVTIKLQVRVNAGTGDIIESNGIDYTIKWTIVQIAAPGGAGGVSLGQVGAYVTYRIF